MNGNGLREGIEARKLKEIEFHNKREHARRSGSSDYGRLSANFKYYSVTRKSQEYFADWIGAHCKGKRALDYCCGRGGSSILMAQSGARVTGIDISDESIETCKDRAREAGVVDKTEFFVMDAEKLTFDDNTFDMIVCSGVLHHLDLSVAFKELSRVLKPDGSIICIEALGHNPFINLYRRLTPHLRTEWEAEHILKLGDLDLARRFFAKVDVRFFHLFSIGAVLFRKTPLFGPILGALDAIDALALKVPGIKTQAWQMIFTLSSPRK